MLIHRTNIWTNRTRGKEYFNLVCPVFLIDPTPAASSGQECDQLPEVTLRVQGNGESEASGATECPTRPIKTSQNDRSLHRWSLYLINSFPRQR